MEAISNETVFAIFLTLNLLFSYKQFCSHDKHIFHPCLSDYFFFWCRNLVQNIHFYTIFWEIYHVCNKMGKRVQLHRFWTTPASFMYFQTKIHEILCQSFGFKNSLKAIMRENLLLRWWQLWAFQSINRWLSMRWRCALELNGMKCND